MPGELLSEVWFEIIVASAHPMLGSRPVEAEFDMPLRKAFIQKLSGDYHEWLSEGRLDAAQYRTITSAADDPDVSARKTGG